MAVKKLARHVASGQSLIERLVGVAINSLADESLGTIVGSGQLNDAKFADFSARLGQLKPLRSIVDALDESERWSQLNLLIGFASAIPALAALWGMARRR